MTASISAGQRIQEERFSGKRQHTLPMIVLANVTSMHPLGTL